MRPLVEILDVRLTETLRAVTGAADAAAVVRPAADERFGDFQANGTIGLAKRLGRKGPDLAREVADRIPPDDTFERVEVAGPGFINMRLRAARIGELLGAMARDERLGLDRADPPRTVVVDFSSPNVAKEMHIGHIRSTILGDAISRTIEHLGHRVRRINHVGDWGTQFGMLIQYLRREYPAVVAGRERLSVGDLEEFYRRAKACFDADPAFAEAARAEVVKLQGGDAEARSAWRAICEESRRKFQENYDDLGVRIEEMGESFYNPFLLALVDDLLARGIARESEGALCVFTPGSAAPFMVRKSDGGFGYAATDLAALRYRVGELGAERIIYVTDARQKEHFRQLFETARRAAYAPPAVALQHVAFGSVLGKDRKPLKTREGSSIKLRDVIAEAIERSRAVVRAKGEGLDAAEVDRIARIVGLGALKYADLSQHPTSDYEFDWDTMLALDGDTAPYLQYAYARIRSIFRKGGVDPAAVRETPVAIAEEAERRLGIWLLRWNEIVEGAAAECRPNIIAGYLYELAVRFTGFYAACPVLKGDARASRLALCDVTARVLERGLALLGIDVSERM